MATKGEPDKGSSAGQCLQEMVKPRIVTTVKTRSLTSERNKKSIFNLEVSQRGEMEMGGSNNWNQCTGVLVVNKKTD